VDNWKNITNSQNRVRKKSFGGTFCLSNCHKIGLDTEGKVFLVSGCAMDYAGKYTVDVLVYRWRSTSKRDATRLSTTFY
jgi:hypothetical protein